MKRLPIRWKFALWAAALVGVVLAAFAGGTLFNLYHEQLEAVDLSLEAQIRQLREVKASELVERTPDELLRYEPWQALAVFDASGRLVRRSPQLPEVLAREAVAETTLHTAHAPEGEAWRLASARLGEQTLVVAQTLTEVSDITSDLLFSYALSMPVVLLIAGGGGWWIAGRALRPLSELAAAAESVRADRPEWRVPADAASARDEIQRLTQVLNAMLTRLETSFQQAQRFAADASHELRTPLTIMHGEIERLLRTPALDTVVEEKLLSLQEEMLRLDRITEHLLLLARFDAGSVRMRREAVDFSKLVAVAGEDVELLCVGPKLRLSTTVEPGMVVQGDAAHLRRALLALLDNAVRYNHSGGEITCTLTRRDQVAWLSVRNTGTGIPLEFRGQLFQRFFRVDTARTRGGHGLGLSLAREIARAHGGEVAIAETSEVGWTEFIASVPLLTETSALKGSG